MRRRQWYRGRIPAPDENTRPESTYLMSLIDAMSSQNRALVREYGFTIVYEMVRDGYTNPKELADILKVWRYRRQQETLESA